MLWNEHRLIGISGKLGSGKTTLARFIQEHNKNLIKKSFAENLRLVLSIMTGIPVEKTRTTQDKKKYLPKWGKTVGQLLQEIGTEMGRSIHREAWVISLFSTFDPASSNWIIDDVRFPEEADTIKKNGGIMIRLKGDPGNLRENETRNLNHSSELALDDYKHFDVIINTDKFVNNLTGLIHEIENKIYQLRYTIYNIKDKGYELLEMFEFEQYQNAKYYTCILAIIQSNPLPTTTKNIIYDQCLKAKSLILLNIDSLEDDLEKIEENNDAINVIDFIMVNLNHLLKNMNKLAYIS
jgi:hypothetical protein